MFIFYVLDLKSFFYSHLLWSCKKARNEVTIFSFTWCNYFFFQIFFLISFSIISFSSLLNFIFGKVFYFGIMPFSNSSCNLHFGVFKINLSEVIFSQLQPKFLILPSLKLSISNCKVKV